MCKRYNNWWPDEAGRWDTKTHIITIIQLECSCQKEDILHFFIVITSLVGFWDRQTPRLRLNSMSTMSGPWLVTNSIFTTVSWWSFINPCTMHYWYNLLTKFDTQQRYMPCIVVVKKMNYKRKANTTFCQFDRRQSFLQDFLITTSANGGGHMTLSVCVLVC